MKVFVDANIWFSAIYKKGFPYRAILACFQKGHEIVICQQVLEEILLVMERKYPQGISLLRRLLLQINPTVLKDPPLKELKKISQLATPEDLPLLGAALKYHCNCFVTGNTKDFAIKKIEKGFKLSIITPKEFVEQFS